MPQKVQHTPNSGSLTMDQVSSAAAHTYSFRASVDAPTGTATGGVGGTGAYVPGFIRIIKV